ncbi:MAG: O-methyltransferase [Halodesulfurarchaeum sp.]
MPDVLDTEVAAVLSMATPDPEAPLVEMAEHGEARDFPTIGPDAGRALRFLASLVDAKRIFEFGSGFGYSAAWFLGALPPAGEIVLTDYEASNLEEAADFLGRLSHEATVHYEPGDAMETFETFEGPFDVVLIDHDKESYVTALERALPQVRPGGLVIADNMLAGPTTPSAVRAALEERDSDETGATAAIATYIRTVRDHPSLESMMLPLGEGQLVSRKTAPGP